MIEQMIFSGEKMTDELISVIESKQAKQADIARYYAIAIKARNVDFEKVNEAILKRYRHSGLIRIKEMAWKQ